MTDKMREFVDEVKQLCKDFSDQRDRPYMGDVHAALDGLYEQWQSTHSITTAKIERLRDITRIVAAQLLHTLPMGAACSCSQCELIQEARAAIAAEGEK